MSQTGCFVGRSFCRLSYIYVAHFLRHSPSHVWHWPRTDISQWEQKPCRHILQKLAGRFFVVLITSAPSLPPLSRPPPPPPLCYAARLHHQPLAGNRSESRWVTARSRRGGGGVVPVTSARSEARLSAQQEVMTSYSQRVSHWLEHFLL